MSSVRGTWATALDPGSNGQSYFRSNQIQHRKEDFSAFYQA